jgi:hypothetical protein
VSADPEPTVPNDGGDVAASTAVLAVFRAARQAPRRRIGRRIVTAIAVVFGLVALAAIATHDQGDGTDAIAVVAPVGVSATTPAPVTTGAPSTGSSVPGQSSSRPTGAGSAGASPSSSGVGSGTGSTAAPGGTATTAPPAASPTTTAPAAPVDVAVVTPLLKVFTFGSKVGLPLLCNVAASALAAQFPDPTVAQLITTVVTSCLDAGFQGADAIAALNEQLASLAAINPVLVPAIDALVDVFNTAGGQDVPFASSLLAIGKLLSFFSVPSP